MLEVKTMFDQFAKALERVILTYSSIHRIHGEPVPIKESTWEYICVQAAEAIQMSYEYDEGSHTCGQDMVLDGQIMSCKTSSITLTSGNVKMSSYRMTKCSKVADFIHEIDVVRKNFDYYLWLVRRETSKGKIVSYHVYMVPSTLFTAGKLVWSETNEASKSKVWSGWGSAYKMQIVGAMSNQLWIDVPLRVLKQYELTMVSMDRCIPKNLLDIAKMIYDSESDASPSPSAPSGDVVVEERGSNVIRTRSRANLT